MKKWITGAAMVALALGYSQRADASIFLDITDGTADAQCNNNTSGGVTACLAAGFTTTLGSNNIGFGGAFGNFNIGGYTFTGTSGVSANVPGLGTTGLVSDSKLNLVNNSDASPLTVTFAAFNFTLPTGPSMGFSSSDTGNFSTSAAGDQGTFNAWADAANGIAPFVGTAAPTPACTTSGGTTISCSTASPNETFTRGAGMYSLIGQEVITLGKGDTASFQATAVTSSVPEPVTFSLMGVGLLGLGLLRKRISRS